MKRTTGTRGTAGRIAAGALLLAGLTGAAAYAEPAKTGRETPPPAQKAKAIQFPAFQQKTLANGLRVVVIEQHEEPLVDFRLVVSAGKLYEPEDKPGLSGATASPNRAANLTARRSRSLSSPIRAEGSPIARRMPASRSARPPT